MLARAFLPCPLLNMPLKYHAASHDAWLSPTAPRAFIRSDSIRAAAAGVGVETRTLCF
ncbi:MAG: hypothetical protein ACREO7_14910 [Pseudoxanthomonas sp.]